jgi:hypothetical protein
MNGRQGMNGGEGEFFIPKQQMDMQEAEAAPSRLVDMKEFNTSFLDSLNSYGDTVWNFMKRLAAGFASLHAAMRNGKLSPATAQRARLLVAVVAAACIAAVARAAHLRKQRKLALDSLYSSARAARWHSNAIVAPPPTNWPRASL